MNQKIRTLTKTMLLASLALSTPLLLSVPAPADPSVGRTRLAITGEHGCFIRADETVQCWGARDTGQTTPPPDLDHPTHLAALTYHTCAADQAGVTCWGLFPFYAPASDVSKIAVSDYNPFRHTYTVCYIHDGGALTCTGSLGQQVPSSVADFIDVAMTPSGFACAVSQSRGLLCFGWPMSTEGQIPSLVDVTSIHATGEAAFCAVADRQPRCWGVFDPQATEGLPEIQEGDLFAVRRNRDEVFCGYGRAVNRLWCAADDRTTPLVAELPRVLDVDEIQMSANAACVVSAGRVKCWGQGDVVGSVPPGIRL